MSINNSSLNSFEKLSHRNLSDQIVLQIKTMIENGIIIPGDRLPSERELARQLNVSRLPLREALKSLQQVNVLEIRQNGYYVLGLESSKLVDFFTDAATNHSLHDDIKEVRIIIEIGAVELACKNRKDSDIIRIQESLAKMEEMVRLMDHNGIIDTSMKFHDDIVGSCGNRLFMAIMAAMTSVLYEGRKKTLEHADRYITATKEHREILDAIINKDAKTAKRIMKIHLETAYC